MDRAKRILGSALIIALLLGFGAPIVMARISNPGAGSQGGGSSISTPVSVANGGTGLATFGGTNHVLYTTAADTLASEAAFTYNASTNLLAADNLTILSTGELLVPAAADPTVATANELAFNTTAASTSIRFHDGTAERVFNNIRSAALPLASSTLVYYGGFGAAGTTTQLVWNPPRPITLLSVTCRTDTGTAKGNFNDGTNLSTMFNCSTTGARTTMSANNTWTMLEDFKYSVGTSASSPNFITISIEYREDAD
jgi:hypothetical protein